MSSFDEAHARHLEEIRDRVKYIKGYEHRVTRPGASQEQIALNSSRESTISWVVFALAMAVSMGLGTLFAPPGEGTTGAILGAMAGIPPAFLTAMIPVYLYSPDRLKDPVTGLLLMPRAPQHVVLPYEELVKTLEALNEQNPGDDTRAAMTALRSDADEALTLVLAAVDTDRTDHPVVDVASEALCDLAAAACALAEREFELAQMGGRNNFLKLDLVLESKALVEQAAASIDETIEHVTDVLDLTAR